MASDRIQQARSIAERAAEGALDPAPAAGEPRTRYYAIGDPQTRLEQFLAILDSRQLIGDDGWLCREVGLVCMGDYFDFRAAHTHDPEELESAGQSGLLILEWLAAHPPDQVVLLFGNHDAARVMELCRIDDVRFAMARDLALAAFQSQPRERRRIEAEFLERFGDIPTPEVARRDFSTFHSSQREALQRHLMAGRLCLAVVGKRTGQPVLLTHAGLTVRELEILGLSRESSACTIARALNDCLTERVAQVAPLWANGAAAALDLEPLHVAGVSGQEAGGFLSHRPANPERSGVGRQPDLSWEFRPERPRRFHPHDLPPGLVQACGHTRAPSSARELDPWVASRAAEARVGELRTLRVRDRRIVYDTGLLEPEPADAVLYMLDADLHQAGPAEVGLMELSSLEPCG